MMSQKCLVVMALTLSMAPAFAKPAVQQWDGDHLAGSHAPRIKKESARPLQSRHFLAVVPRSAPVLTGLNYGMAPPGAVLTISGTNFSPNVDDNKVFFSNIQALVTGASPNALSVVVPNWAYGQSQLGIPVTVISHGTPSSNALKFDIGAKYLTPDQI